jgi:serine/threonine-protein kinase HipA
METITEQLVVTLGDRRVGILSRHNRQLAFVCDQQWRDDPRSYLLSLSLPLREAPFADVDTLTWFGNLLPEGDLQKAVARCLGSSTGDVFGMLTDLGEK